MIIAVKTKTNSFNESSQKLHFFCSFWHFVGIISFHEITQLSLTLKTILLCRRVRHAFSDMTD